MPVFLAAFLGGLISAASSIVGRVLLALGVGFVAYSGITATLDWLQAQVVANLQGLPGRVVQLLGVLQVDVSVSILFSAVAARLVLQGLTSGVLKRMVIR